MTLPKFGRLLLIISIIFILANYLPEFYWLKFDTPVSKPLVNYSPVLSTFLSGNYDGREFVWEDNAGNKYTRDEYEQFSPGANFRQLLYDKNLPDTVNGFAMDFDSLRLHRIMYKITPRIINSWQIPLYPLFESASGRIKLSMPDDFFRIDEKGIIFLNSGENNVAVEKSKLFTDVMKKGNFSFPAKIIAGNPSPMKPFDEGYFILDSQDKLFHLKMVKGKPFFKYMNNPPEIKIKFILLQENNLLRFYGAVISSDNKIYSILYDNYKMLPMPIDKFNFEKDRFVYMGDYLNKNLLVENDKVVTDYATDNNFKFIGKFSNEYYDGSKDAAISTANVLFPYTLSFVDANSGMIDSFFSFSDWRALWGILVSLAIALFILKKRKAIYGLNYLDIVIVAVSGIYGLIAIALIKNID
ncbi:MAG: DUF4857 domain-containing protein [Ignavibacteriaceae bacterium]|nr:DUF4857 domain-containing protein [Ignavibacteriaceae bacterium]